MATVGNSPALDFDRFHRERLPEHLAAGRGRVAAAAATGCKPLALRVGTDASFTYVPRDGSIAIEPGHETAATIIELDVAAWEEFAGELRSAPGLLYSGKVECVRGHAMRFIEWEPVLRSLYHGREVFVPGTADLRDADGSPLDPTRSFCMKGLDDGSAGAEATAAEMRHFLGEAGYLIVRDVFSPDEVASLLDEAERLRAATARDDDSCWWARNAQGEDVLCRIIYAGRRSSLLAGLFDDERVQRLIALSNDRVLPTRDSYDGVSVLFKHREASEGLSDLPWHADCGLGGHPILCPLIVMSVHLTEMNAESGELRVLPGSWGKACRPIDANDPDAPTGVGLSASPGSCTLHYGDLMHAAPPPTGTSVLRTSLLLPFLSPAALELMGPGQSYNDLLGTRTGGQVEHLRDLIEKDAT